MSMTSHILHRCRAAGAAALCGLALLGAGCQSGGLKPSESPAAIDQNMRQASQLAVEAKAKADKGKNDEAIELNQRALALNPSHAGAWNNLGVLLMKKQNYRDAMQAFSRAADLLPRDPRPYENLALCWRDAGYDEDALKYFKLSLDRNPDWLPSLRGAVACAQQLNRADYATREYIGRALLIESDPKWRALFERARVRVESELKTAAQGRDRGTVNLGPEGGHAPGHAPSSVQPAAPGMAPVRPGHSVP